jgi:hypothetical protein
MCPSTAIRERSRAKSFGAILGSGIGSYAKSPTLMPTARRLSVRSSGNSVTVRRGWCRLRWEKWIGRKGISVKSIVKIELGHFGESHLRAVGVAAIAGSAVALVLPPPDNRCYCC